MNTPLAHAHVEYVIESTEATTGTDWAFLLSTFSDPLNLFLTGLTALIVISLNYFLPRLPTIAHLFRRVRRQAYDYTQLRSWILRLSLGIALIGAGLSQSLISPAAEVGHWPSLALIEVITGFLLLAGFLIGPAIVAVIVLYILGLFQNPYLIGNLETLAAAIALLALANARPGIDNLLGIPTLSPIRSWKPYVPLILRIGIGIAMIFLGLYEKILNPQLSAQVVTSYHLTDIVPVSTAMWVLGAGLIELILGTLLLVGYRVRTVAAVTVIVLTLSFFYFGEEVYSHVTLFGVLSVLFITGAGRISVDLGKRNVI